MILSPINVETPPLNILQSSQEMAFFTGRLFYLASKRAHTDLD